MYNKKNYFGIYNNKENTVEIDTKNDNNIEDLPGVYRLPKVIEAGSLNSIIDKILVHNVKNDVDVIQLFCDCDGGLLRDTFKLIHIMEKSVIPIYTINDVAAYSAATMILTVFSKKPPPLRWWEYVT